MTIWLLLIANLIHLAQAMLVGWQREKEGESSGSATAEGAYHILP